VVKIGVGIDPLYTPIKIKKRHNDPAIHALVEFGTHGKYETIQNLRCQFCRKKFTHSSATYDFLSYENFANHRCKGFAPAGARVGSVCRSGSF
jgi:hypothetical protein